ncbi:MAG: ABC transporter permease [Tunicatimonas sp.]
MITRFLRRFCDPGLLPEIEGDLYELYQRWVEERGLKKARWLYALNVITFLRPLAIRKKENKFHYATNSSAMLRNYFIIAVRNLQKNKAFSLINIFGLAIGMAACLLIVQYVSFELSYDDFHKNADTIYRVSAAYDQTSDESLLVPSPLGPELQKDFPEVIKSTRLMLPWSGQAASSTLSWQGQPGELMKQTFRWGFYTDPEFLEMFSFPWIRGDQERALAGTHRVVLSESAARKLFGNHWAENDRTIGQTLEYLNEFDRFQLVVTGIIGDAPVNSHLQYDFLVSFATLSTGWGKEVISSWDGNGVYTYVQMHPATDVHAFQQKVSSLVAERAPERFKAETDFSMQPLRNIYLYSHLQDELKVNGNANYVSFLSLIAGLILLIALLNYINLTTAQAITRSKEVGLRKVMGALRPQLIKQFLLESLLLNAVAFISAIVLVQTAMPSFTQLLGKSVDSRIGDFWWVILLFPASTLISGFYPAFVLSGFRPMKTLSGKLTYTAHGKGLRQGMVVFQFCVSMILIIFTFAVVRQLQYMQSSDPGFDREGVMVVKGPVNRTETWIEHDQQKDKHATEDAFKVALSQNAGIEASSLSWSIPGEKNSIYSIVLGEAYQNGQIDGLVTDSDYADVYNLELLAGRFDTENGFVINERAAEILGYPEPAAAVGQVFKDARNRERKIRGVIKSYHHHSLHHKIRPLIFGENDPTYKLDSYYSIKVSANRLDASIANISTAYKQVYPYDPFEYYFISAYFDAQYREDQRFGVLFGLFSGLAIFIACLGLFSLSSYSIAQRTQEIGIRKVLGASVSNVVALLSQDLVKLVLVASFLALPVAYWALQRWLADYAFHITISWWLLALPVVLVLLITLFTVSFQTVKAALANPVDSLRNE